MNKQTLETECKNYNPDRDYNGGYGHYLADLVFKQKENKELEKLAEVYTEIEFVKAVKNSGINIDNEFGERYEKERLIKKYTHYTKLNGLGKKKEFLKDCSDNKIGSAFKNIYNSAMRKIKEYERGEGK